MRASSERTRENVWSRANDAETLFRGLGVAVQGTYARFRPVPARSFSARVLSPTLFRRSECECTVTVYQLSVAYGPARLIIPPRRGLLVVARTPRVALPLVDTPLPFLLPSPRDAALLSAPSLYADRRRSSSSSSRGLFFSTARFSLSSRSPPYTPSGHSPRRIIATARDACL